MNRIHLKKNYKFRKIRFCIIIIILIIISSFVMLINISNKITPILTNLAEIKVNKYSNTVINKAVSQVLEDKINVDKLFNNVTKDDGTIELIDFNTIAVNQILSIATTVVLNNLILLENGNLDAIGVDGTELTNEEKINLKNGIVAFVPIGSATNIALFSNLGPKIPVRLHYTGDVNSNIFTKITPYGINNALIEIGLHIEVSSRIILPFTSKIKVLENDIPIAIKMIQGKIPDFYQGGYFKKSNEFKQSKNNVEN